MNHRIAAGVIVEDDGCTLLVRHRKIGVYDFWVAPGGGANDGKNLLDATSRRAVWALTLAVIAVLIALEPRFRTAERETVQVDEYGVVRMMAA